MKINSLSETPRLEHTAPDKPATSASSSAASGAQVEFSGLATRLSQLETQFSGADFDAAKVEAIRSAIAEGRFQVQASAVADRLLESVDQLLGRKA